MSNIEIDHLEHAVEKRTMRRHKRKHPTMKVNSRSVFSLVKTIKQRAVKKP